MPRAKEPQGMSEVLYVRRAHDLVAALDLLVAVERAKRPGHLVSRSDVAREILWRAVRAEEVPRG
jgi:hypothetical protein